MANKRDTNSFAFKQQTQALADKQNAFTRYLKQYQMQNAQQAKAAADAAAASLAQMAQIAQKAQLQPSRPISSFQQGVLSSVDLTTLISSYGTFNKLRQPNISSPQGGNTSVANKFKDGDRVVFKAPNTVLTGFEGDVVSYKEGAYAVHFDTALGTAMHKCDGLVPDGQGYWCGASQLEIIEKKPVVVINFDSVIISEDKRQQILEALEQINKEDLIFEKWGFKDTIEKGKGLGLLFYGEPGTGKTLMGQAIAHKLDRKLRIIGTADIESSKPGEAERNIRKYFEEAKKDKAILLFDECDSLIYSRQGVGPILGAQINELLSQIERFEGVTIFTTNRLGTLDEAVNRRLALKLEFGMPTPEERVEIWKRMIPKKAPIAKDVDYVKLSVVEITGGYIKNAVLRAARMAAIQDMPDKDKTISHAHFVKALTLEAKAMVEFKKAREDHTRGIGVARHVGGRTIVTGNDKDRDRE